MGQPNGITTSFCRIHENVFRLYLWCVDDFLTDWLDNFHKIGGAYKFLYRLTCYCIHTDVKLVDHIWEGRLWAGGIYSRLFQAEWHPRTRSSPPCTVLHKCVLCDGGRERWTSPLLTAFSRPGNGWRSKGSLRPDKMRQDHKKLQY